jgi:hypothetical protein
MNDQNLSPLAMASRELVFKLAKGAHPDEVETGCRELIRLNTNGLGSADTQVVEVASEIVRGVLAGVFLLRSPAIAAMTRGMSESGKEGTEGDAERLSIAERSCRDVRDSHDASGSDYRSALAGAAQGARMSPDELAERIERSSPAKKRKRR